MSFPHRSPLSFSVGPVRRLPYLSALDGLRAIAVIAVMIYHADERWLQGGYLGVEVFFTISGYLITALLITEYERTGRIDLMAFWKRRANRLLPALGVLLAGVAVLALFTARDALVSLGGQAVAALAYVMNWSLIATQQSYFESFGRPPLLQHLWSLAVEEQFYLAFPILFFLGRRLIGRRAFLAVVSIGVVVSTIMVWRGFDPTVDPSRLYYGTDTRAAGLLVGVALALVWRPWTTPGGGSVRTAAVPDVVGIVGLGVLVSQFMLLGAYDARLYHGGFLTVSVATAAVIGAVVTPGSMLAMPLSTHLLRWVGARSYGLYLWHWPLFMVLRPGVDTIVSDPWLTLIRLGATVAIAEVSYTYIEQPIRQGQFVEHVRRLRRAIPEQAALKRGSIVALGSLVALVAVGNAQLPADRASAQSAARPVTPAADVGDQTSQVVRLRPGPAPSSHDKGQPVGLAQRYDRIYIYGDSVFVGATDRLAAISGNVVVDARIGRQWHELVDDDQTPGADDAVVIHLGSNGATNTATMDQVLDHFSDAGRVVLVNVRVPRPWETAVNRALSGATARWPNTVLADWKGASDNTPAYFGGDGVHVSEDGAQALASVVVAGLTAP